MNLIKKYEKKLFRDQHMSEDEAKEVFAKFVAYNIMFFTRKNDDWKFFNLIFKN